MKKVNWEIGRRKLVCGLLLASALMAQGCATATAGAGGAGVLERAKAYWATVLANELTESWRYEEMSKDPRWTLQNYLKRSQITYDTLEVLRVVSETDTDAVVEVKVRYSVPTLKIKAMEAVMRDDWKKIDGQWYHALPKNSLLQGEKTPVPAGAKQEENTAEPRSSKPAQP